MPTQHAAGLGRRTGSLRDGLESDGVVTICGSGGGSPAPSRGFNFDLSVSGLTWLCCIGCGGPAAALGRGGAGQPESSESAGEGALAWPSHSVEAIDSAARPASSLPVVALVAGSLPGVVAAACRYWGRWPQGARLGRGSPSRCSAVPSSEDGGCVMLAGPTSLVCNVHELLRCL